MQLSKKYMKKNIYSKTMTGITALIWIAGLLIAGSESPYMPWMNLAGGILFLGTSFWLGRVLPMFETQKEMAASSKSVMTRDSIKLASEKRNFKVNTRYAGKLSVV